MYFDCYCDTRKTYASKAYTFVRGLGPRIESEMLTFHNLDFDFLRCTIVVGCLFCRLEFCSLGACSLEVISRSFLEENQNETNIAKCENKVKMIYCFCLMGPPARPRQPPFCDLQCCHNNSYTKSAVILSALVALGFGGFIVNIEIGRFARKRVHFPHEKFIVTFSVGLCGPILFIKFSIVKAFDFQLLKFPGELRSITKIDPRNPSGVLGELWGALGCSNVVLELFEILEKTKIFGRCLKVFGGGCPREPLGDLMF